MKNNFLKALMEMSLNNYYTYYICNKDKHFYKQRKLNLLKNFIYKIMILVLEYIEVPTKKTKIKLNEKKIKSKYRDIHSLDYLYNNLADKYSKNRLVEVIYYRIFGKEKIKLLNNIYDYESIDEKLKYNILKNQGKIYIYELKRYLYCYNLNSICYNLNLFSLPIAIYLSFISKQYEYINESVRIKAEIDDYVIDAGACWGDTSLYFAHEVKDKGKVFAFEFIPNNLIIFNKYLSLNPKIKGNISLIERPLWDSSGKSFYFLDKGPGSSISDVKLSENSVKIESISIDDFVRNNNIDKIDFIKMDIEGAELAALKGSIATIKKHKPKLAIAIYHNIDQFLEIPRFLISICPSYVFYFEHYTMHTFETVLYAIVQE